MPSWLEALRLKNIHDPQLNMDMNEYDQGPQTNVMMDATDMPDMSGPVMRAGDYDYGPPKDMGFQPEHEATDRFNELIKGYPQRESPSFLRTVAASLSAFGAGGPQAGQAVMDEPNVRKMADWKNQIGPAQQAANLERQENVNARTLAYQTEQTKLGQAKLDEKTKNDADRIRISEGNAKTRRMLAENPDFKPLPETGGTVKLYDSKSNKIIDTGIQSGEMDDETKLKMQQTQALERLDRGETNAEKLERLRQTGRMELERTPKAKLATDGEKDLTEAQIATRNFTRAQETANKRPDLAPFIQLDTAGRFTVKDPYKEGAMFTRGKPSPAQWKEINDLIYAGRAKNVPGINISYEDASGKEVEGPPDPGEVEDILSEPNMGETVEGVQSQSDANRFAPPPQAAKPYTPNPKYAGQPKVEVTKNGQTFKVPQGQLQQAISEGYTPTGKTHAPAPAPRPIASIQGNGLSQVAQSIQKPRGRMIAYWDPDNARMVSVPETQSELADRRNWAPTDLDPERYPIMNMLMAQR